uniref:Uncharacterized protein n=1 Tax=Micrurus lemniscatus lemniscatus TaxID=129467 RepID=A0A2D4IJ99_MICLE
MTHLFSLSIFFFPFKMYLLQVEKKEKVTLVLLLFQKGHEVRVESFKFRLNPTLRLEGLQVVREQGFPFCGDLLYFEPPINLKNNLEAPIMKHQQGHSHCCRHHCCSTAQALLTHQKDSKQVQLDLSDSVLPQEIASLLWVHWGLLQE